MVVSPPRERPIACSPFFSCAGAVLVGAHDSGVDHHVFIVVVAPQQPENALENATLRPPAETLMHNLPIAEALGQVAPGDAGTITVQHGFDEQPIVRRRASHMAFTTGQKILDPVPLIVA